ncbi:MAG: hypoxanthine phosphoribosyltransferase [Planctomycetota bacterium]|jgi:hypoxanthine phosphoribosyltransferase
MSPETTPILDDPMHADLDKVLLDRERIARRVAELADEISHDLQGVTNHDEIVIVSILTGSIIFLADLIRRLPQKLRIEVIGVESYPGRATESQGPKITRNLAGNIEGKHVLIVDDILDSGGTMRLIREVLGKRQPKSVRACVLLRKERPSAMEMPCDYVGFDIPDVFVVGYGLDYNNYYRNLPDIGTLKEEAL